MKNVQDKKDKTLSTVILTVTLALSGLAIATAAPSSTGVQERSDVITVINSTVSNGGSSFSSNTSGGSLGK